MAATARASTDEAGEKELFFLSLNEDKEQTIVLLHALLSSRLEYEMVTPHLSNYHLLVPDINGHSNSADILPATIQASTERVAALIAKHAHGGKAHVVGLSMGGFITWNLAKEHPELVHTAFASGAAPFQGFLKWLTSRPSLIWYGMKVLIGAMPDGMYWWLVEKKGMRRHEQLLAEMRTNLRWEVVRDVYLSAQGNTWKVASEVRARTLTVAGGKEDDVPATKRMGELLPVEGSKAYVVKEAIHGWDLVFPELFARGILAWIEGRPLPDEYEALE